jgi:hypothetical protein
MITFVRTAVVAPGKMAEIMAFNQQALKLIKDKYGVDVHVSIPIGGNPNRIAWTASHPSLAEFDSLSVKIMADADYQKLLDAHVGTVLPGSLHDELWRSV